jgi:hypothetical protein
MAAGLATQSVPVALRAGPGQGAKAAGQTGLVPLRQGWGRSLAPAA